MRIYTSTREKMAAGTVPHLQRSISYSNSGEYENEDIHRRYMDQRRSVRKHSIVGSFWNLLYKRKQSSFEMQSEVEETDHTPEGSSDQEDAWMPAYYNGVVLVVLLVAGYLCWAVYCVLEPFLHPLLWAILIGTILHPFKKTWTERISQWLNRLEDNSIPLSAGLILSPLFIFNYISKLLETTILEYWVSILVSIVGMALMWLLYHFRILVHLYTALSLTHSFILFSEEILSSYTGPIQLVTVTIGFVLLLAMSRSNLRYTTALTILSTLVWFLALLNVTGYLISRTIALPLVTVLFVTGATVSFAITVKNAVDGIRDKSSGKSGKKSDPLKRSNEVRGDEGGVEEEGRSREESPPCLEEVKCSGDNDGDNNDEAMDGKDAVDEGESNESSQLGFHEPDDVEMSRSHVSFDPVAHIVSDKSHIEKMRGEGTTSRSQRSRSPLKDLTTPTDEWSQSDYIFLGLYILFFITVFWTYPFLLILLIPFVAWGALKRVISVGVGERGIFRRLDSSFQTIQGWIATRRSLFLPSPLPTLVKLYLFLDRSILIFAKGSVDTLISLFIIVGLLVSGLGLTIFLVVQIQVELSHYVTMMAAVWERTLDGNPQLVEWLGGGDSDSQTIHDTFGSFANQGYMYGREWLAGQVQSVVADSSDKGSAIEKQVLSLYDQLYQSYVLDNSTTLGPGHTPLEFSTNGDLFNELTTVIINNLETITTLLKSMWAVLSDNLSLAISLLYTVLGLLLSGGTVLINTVVFLTTLFYLLCYSADVYLPVKIVLDVLPSVTQSDTAGQYTASFSRAIRSVFHASLGRLMFYGLYTWLVHTAFGLPVSILPAVLAAIAGALPFIGPYWIALPAVLELWLVEGETMSAIAVLTLSLLPMFFIDSIIYGEVEGGHPYLTGLAVAGGIYFAGLEGAIIGPILLCCLVFIHELFGEIMFTHTQDVTP